SDLAPVANSALPNTLTQAKRIRRGGSYLSDARVCRSSAKIPTPPDEALADVGFRVALAPIDVASPTEYATLNDLENNE
ncbi:MAG: hypothetical protein IKW13_04805, partial [Thermoguttaceae bacterium]|nr:hypothetical protein [Thermoguttaceae bacterium]